MKINLDAEIQDLEGKVVQLEGKAFTLKKICVESLLNTSDAATVNGEEKMKRFLLAEKLWLGGVQDLAVEEITKIKELIGKCYATLAVGKAFKLLNTPHVEPVPAPAPSSSEPAAS